MDDLARLLIQQMQERAGVVPPLSDTEAREVANWVLSTGSDHGDYFAANGILLALLENPAFAARWRAAQGCYSRTVLPDLSETSYQRKRLDPSLVDSRAVSLPRDSATAPKWRGVPSNPLFHGEQGPSVDSFKAPGAPGAARQARRLRMTHSGQGLTYVELIEMYRDKARDKARLDRQKPPRKVKKGHYKGGVYHG